MQKKSKVSEKAEINLLLSKAQKGDDQAFSELLSMYEPLLLSMAAKYLIEYDAREDREDLIQFLNFLGECGHTIELLWDYNDRLWSTPELTKLFDVCFVRKMEELEAAIEDLYSMD